MNIAKRPASFQFVATESALTNMTADHSFVNYNDKNRQVGISLSCMSHNKFIRNFLSDTRDITILKTEIQSRNFNFKRFYKNKYLYSALIRCLYNNYFYQR